MSKILALQGLESETAQAELRMSSISSLSHTLPFGPVETEK
ncbi:MULTISPECIES: hypothetical protein [unclassified Kitasatospora]